MVHWSNNSLCGPAETTEVAAAEEPAAEDAKPTEGKNQRRVISNVCSQKWPILQLFRR